MKNRAMFLRVTLCLAVLSLAFSGSARAQTRSLVDITISPSGANVVPTGTQVFTATGLFSDGTSEDVTSQVTWKARDTKIGTIDSSGLATGVSTGRTDISATIGRVTSRRVARLTVAKLLVITVLPEFAGLRIGNEMPLQAIGTYDSGAKADLTMRVQWSSLKTSVIEVGVNESGEPYAMGVGIGSTNVVARDAASGVKSNSTSGRLAVISVVGNLQSIDVWPDSRVVRVGEKGTFKASGTFERDVKADITGNVDWSTGNPAVASVSEGRALGVSLGSTTVIARDPGSGITSTESGTDGVVNVVGPLTDLRVKPLVADLKLGATYVLRASGRFEGFAPPGGTVTISTRVAWTSSAPEVVNVNRLGLATCLSSGTATISVRDTFSGFTSTQVGGDGVIRCDLPPIGVRVIPGSLSLRVDRKKKVKVYLEYADGSKLDVTKRVTWTNSDPVAVGLETVDPYIGRVSGLAPGVSLIDVVDPVTGFSSALSYSGLRVEVLP